VVIVTVFEDPALIVEAISAGADGYLLKTAGARELLDALRNVAGGGSSLTPAVARHLLDWMRDRPQPSEANGDQPRIAQAIVSWQRTPTTKPRVRTQGMAKV
jgi:DNA-binding NarL/FixJ family response regulator